MNAEKEIQIDILYILKKLWSKKILILAISLLFLAVSVAYSVFLVTPLYESTTKIYAVKKDDDKNQNLTVQDLQIGSSLVKDYQEIIVSKYVLEEVIEKENNNLKISNLEKKISITSPKDTRVINITVSDKDPKVAQRLANLIREVSSTKIKEVTKSQDVTTLEEATLPAYPSSPNVKKNGGIAFVLGFIIISAIIVLKELIDDKVKRPEDVEEVLDLVLLGVIPDTKKGLK